MGKAKWTYRGRIVDSIDDMPKDTYGFIYEIFIKIGNEYKTYIGKKKLISVRKKKFTKKQVEALKDKRLKKYTYEHKEMPWREYTGSSKQLNALIEEHGEENLMLSKKILLYCKSEAELKFKEAKEIICSDAVLDDNSFNDAISLKVIGKPKFV